MPTRGKMNATEDRSIYCGTVVEWMHPTVGEQLGWHHKKTRRGGDSRYPLVSFPVAAYITGSRGDKTQLTGAEQRRVRTAAVLSRRGVLLYWRLNCANKPRRGRKAESRHKCVVDALAVSAPPIRCLLRKFDWKECAEYLWTNSNRRLCVQSVKCPPLNLFLWKASPALTLLFWWSCIFILEKDMYLEETWS